MFTADLKFMELCDEIDYWKDKTLEWELEAKKYEKKYYEIIDQNIKHSQELSANWMNFLLDKRVKIERI